ncbi:hypothetical protein CRG98_009422 [Punica granatum]|uniref:Uncharacterized protein n=1 Tax=Punica granatum TaxID=22663 RepID=A0A2I0KNX1_PUNGR|nr:hypothetical protein CRG98_009422 [Punica granatum]
MGTYRDNDVRGNSSATLPTLMYFLPFGHLSGAVLGAAIAIGLLAMTAPRLRKIEPRDRASCHPAPSKPLRATVHGRTQISPYPCPSGTLLSSQSSFPFPSRPPPAWPVPRQATRKQTTRAACPTLSISPTSSRSAAWAVAQAEPKYDL